MAKRPLLRVVCALLLGIGAAFGEANIDPALEAALKKYQDDTRFEPNRGQFPEAVLYNADAADYSMRLLKDRVSLVSVFAEGGEAFVWNLVFEGAAEKVRVEPRGTRPTKVNYLSQGIAGVETFEEVWYRGVYPGIDLRFYGKGDGTIEYDFIVAPGAEVSQISLRLEGLESVEIDAESGELELETTLGSLRKGAPYTYQMVEGQEVAVDSGYVLAEDGTLTFRTAPHDPRHPLIIDPTTLLASAATTPQAAEGIGLTVSDDGIYVSGYVSFGATLPTTPGVVGPTHSSALTNPGWLALFSHDLTTLHQMTYIEDTSSPRGGRVYISEIDAENGDVYVGGLVMAPYIANEEGVVPTTTGAFQQFYPKPGLPLDTLSGTMFVMRLSGDLNDLKYSSYVSPPSASLEFFNGMDVQDGLIHIWAGTNAIDYPTTAGAIHESAFTAAGSNKGVFTVINPDPTISDGSDLVYSTYVDAPQTNYPGSVVVPSIRNPIVVGPDGKSYLVGMTSNGDLMTTADAISDLSNLNGTTDGFLWVLDAPANLGNGAADLLYGTGFGAPETSEGGDASLALSGNDLYVAMRVSGGGSSLPLVGDSFSSDNSPTSTVYLARFDLTSKSITASTFSGGDAGGRNITDLAIDSCGDVYLLGHANATGTVSVTPDAVFPSNQGELDSYILRFNSDLSEVIQGTYFGGPDTDEAWDMEYHDGRILIAGDESGGSSSFPTTPGVMFSAVPQSSFASVFSTVRLDVPESLFACPGVDLIVSGVTECGGVAPYTYSWQAQQPGNVVNLQNGSTASPTIAVSADTEFLVTVTDSLGGTHTKTIMFQVIPPAGSFTAGSDAHICAGGSTEIGPHNYDAATYSWAPATGLDDPSSGTPIASPAVTTTYTLTYTDCAATVVQDTVTVYVEANTSQMATILAEQLSDQEVCINTPSVLGGEPLEGFGFEWSPAADLDDPTAAQPTATLFSATTFTVTMTNLCTGESVSDTMNVTLSPASANAGEDRIECPGVGFVVGNPPNAAYTSYLWEFVAPAPSGTIVNPTDANPTVTINESGGGTFELKLTTTSNVVGCELTDDTLSVEVIPSTPIANAGLDQEICVDWPSTTAWLTQKIGTPAVNRITYSWSPTIGLDDPTAAQPIVDPNRWTNHQPGDSMVYTLTITSPCGGAQAQDSVTLTLASDVPFIDAYESEVLDDADGQLNNIFNIPCNGWPIGMDQRPLVHYTWDKQQYLEPLATFEVLDAPAVRAIPPSTMTFTLTATHMCSGISVTDTVTITPNCGPAGPGITFDPASIPSADAGPDLVTLCEGESVQIGTPVQPNPDLSYQWFPTDDLSDPAIPQPTVNAPTIGRTYTLLVTDSVSGLSNWDQITVEVVATPIASAGTSPQTFASAADIVDIQLGPDPGATQFENRNWVVQWNPTRGLDDPSALRPILNGPAVAGGYEVTVTDPRTGCFSTAFVVIDITASFADAGIDQLICPGNEVTIGTAALAGYTYKWSPADGLNNANIAEPTASPEATTTYVVTVTETASGAVDVDEMVVTVTETSTEVADAGDDLSICPNALPEMIGTNTDEGPAATYAWTSATGLAALSATNVPKPTFDPSLLAAGSTHTLTLTVTDVATGCSSQDEMEVAILPDTTPVITAPASVSGCAGDSVDITGVSVAPASDDYTIAWTGGPGIGPKDVLEPTVQVGDVDVDYTLTVTNPCTGTSDSVIVTVTSNTGPSITDMGSYAAVCPSTGVLLDQAILVGATTYTWEILVGAGSFDFTNIEQPTFTPTSTSTLQLTVGDSSGNGCTAMATVTVPVDSPPANAGPDVATCTGSPVQIGSAGDPANYTYAWSIQTGPGPLPGTTNTPQITVDPTGTTTYLVTVTGGACPSTTDTVVVTVSTDPAVADAGAPATICEGESTGIGPASTTDGWTYSWSPAAGLSNANVANPTASPSATTTYTLTVTDCSGTPAVDTVDITVTAAPVADAGSDKTLCEGEEATIGSPAIPGVTYAWSPTTGLSDPTAAMPTVSLDSDITSPTTMTYEVTVTNDPLTGSCDVGTDTVKVTFNPVPELAYENITVCAGTSAVLGDGSSISGIDGSYTVLWSPSTDLDNNRIANPTVTPTESRIYSVTVRTPAGCAVSQTVAVTVEDIDITATASAACAGEDTTIQVDDISGAIYAWTGPNGFTSSNRVNNLTSLTAAEFGTYDVTVTTANGCVLNDSVTLTDACACDIQISSITNVTVGDCEYDPVERQSTADVQVEVTWGAGSPANEDIVVTVGDQSVLILAGATSPATTTITVPANDETLNVRAGFAESTDCFAVSTFDAPAPCPVLANVGNLVFIDADADGMFDDGEGVDGVTLEIYPVGVDPNAAGVTPEATTETADGGCYLFTVPEGDYFIHIPASEFSGSEELVATLSLVGAGVDDGTDDSVDENGIDVTNPAASGVSSGGFNLAQGTEPDAAGTENGKDAASDDAADTDTDLTIDFGFINEADAVGIGNLVFADTNNDGIFDATSESGIDGVLVLLFRAGDDPNTSLPVASTTTVDGGCYQFFGLNPGRYFVHVPGSEFGGAGALFDQISSTGSGVDSGTDDDGDENGLDSGDPVATGIRTALYDLQPTVLPINTGTETGKDRTADDGLDANGNLTVDLGFTPAAGKVGLGNLVFIDGDGDGIYSDGEGRDGVVVQLFYSTDDPLTATPLAQTTTAGGGCYAFVGLDPGSYRVMIPASEFAAGAPLAGHVSVTGLGPDNGNDDSGPGTPDENGYDLPDLPATGTGSDIINLALGAEPTDATTEAGKAADGDNGYDDNIDYTVDFGFVPDPTTVGIGNLVYLDNVVRNGGFDPGEGVDGVLVQLFAQGDDPLVAVPVAETTTADGGLYSFTGLAPDDYFVFIPPSQFAVGAPLDGALSLPVAGGDTGTDDDLDENGQNSASPSTTGIRTGDINLALTEEAVDGATQGAESGQSSGSDNVADNNIDYTVDLGFAEASTSYGVGNLVFIDLNNDGRYNTGDLVFPDIPVELYTAGSVPGTDPAVATTVTDAAGCYEFLGLLSGDYFVHIPSAFFVGLGGEALNYFSSTGAGGDNGVDDTDVTGDENGLDVPLPALTGISTAPFTLDGTEPIDTTGEDGKDASGDNALGDELIDYTIDIGITYAPNSVGVGNLVFTDVHGDGIFSDAAGDTGIDGVLVELYSAGDEPGVDAPVATTVTADGGCYFFTALGAGDYFIHIPSSEFGTSEPLDGLTSSSGAGADDGVDDTANENGLDVAAPASSGVSTANFNLTATQEGAEAGKGGDADDILEGNFDLSIDLGFTPSTGKVGIGNVVFFDGDDSGTYTTGEGVDGVVVELYDQGDVPGVDAPVATTVTHSGGCYLFGGLAPSTGFVHIPSSQFGTGEVLDGAVSLGGAGGDTGIDDNADENGIDTGDPASHGVSSVEITLALSEEPDVTGNETGKDNASDNGATDANFDLTVDFGFAAAATTVGLGNKIFLDLNTNGVYDGEPTDTALGGVTLELYTAAAGPGVGQPVAQTVTDAQGCYAFTGLDAGSYIVHLPASQFGTGEALDGLVSVAGSDGDLGADDNAGENGLDSGEPELTGISSVPIALAVGDEPQTEAGADGSGDAAADANMDFSIDFALANEASSVGLGNLVFVDFDGDGLFDFGEGVDGVTVELYNDGDPTSGPALASVETADGGCYLFTGLAPGSYYVHIPAAEFQGGGDLAGSYSIPGQGGDTGTDDSADENGADAADPSLTGVSSGAVALVLGNEPTDTPVGSENGKDASGDNGITDENVDMTVDLGFTAAKDDTFAAWQTANPLGGQNGFGDNPDGDIYNNALEYAFCLKPDSGTFELAPNASADGGFCVEVGGPTGTSGTVDAFFTRRAGGFSDVTYTLEVAPTLGSPPAWVASTAIAVVTDNGDGTETVTFPDLEAQNADGIARLQVEITGDLTGPHYTPTFGWHTQTNSAACETCSFPYAQKEVFSGTSSTAGTSLTVSGTPALEAGREYYIEVLDGALEGHRFDVASVTADNVTLDAASPRNTYTGALDLTGMLFALRPHTVIDDIVPPELFASNDDSDFGDRILAYVGGAWKTYWVYDMAGTAPKQWTDVDDDEFLADAGAITEVDACQGFFLHPKSGDVDVTSVGVVREWAFACPLDTGYNLVGSGYPLDQSPDDREMFKIDGDGTKDWFTASNDPLSADQLMFWLGDGNPLAEGYDTYFRVDLGIAAYDHWTFQGDSNLADADGDLLFERGRGAFHDMTLGHDRSDLDAVWLWPAPWDSDAP